MKPYFFKKLGVIIIAFTFLFTLGCSLKEVKEEEHPKKAKVLLTNMNFQEKGETTTIVFEGNAPLSYTDMKLFKPKSVVIDFSETSPAKELKPLVINNPNVSSVVPTELTSSFGPITRVEIGLNRDVEYKTRVEGNKLFVDIVPEKKEKITIQKPKPKVLPPANAFIGINI